MRTFLRRVGRWLLLACWTPGSFAGVPVRVHWTAFLFPGAAGLWAGYDARGWTGMALAFLVLELWGLSLLAHEFGHVLVARRYGLACGHVVLLPVGAVALMEGLLPMGGAEIGIAIAGPLVNLVLASLGWLASLGIPGDPGCVLVREVGRALDALVFFNLLLGLSNLAPVFPRDGGRILRALLALGVRRVRRVPDREANLRATRIALRWIGLPLWLGWAAFLGWRFHDLFGAVFLAVVSLLMHAVGEAEILVLRSGDSETPARESAPAPAPADPPPAPSSAPQAA